MTKRLNDELKRAYSVVARTEEGRRVLRDLYELTGYDKSDMVVHPNTLEVCTVSTAVNVAIRSIWCSRRRLIPADVLADIEIVKEGTDDDRQSDDP